LGGAGRPVFMDMPAIIVAKVAAAVAAFRRHFESSSESDACMAPITPPVAARPSRAAALVGERVIPLRFGSPQRELFGMLHRPERGGGGTGVLVCNPFGQEAVRSHRLFRVMAERLVRSGLSVLRFDYFGTGDSSGDEDDADLHAWQLDILQAQAELVQRSGCTRVIWVGARLGGTLALLGSAHAEAEAEPAAVLAWDPILDGPAYLSALARDHEAALKVSYSILPPGLPLRPTDEAMGFALHDRLRAQIAAITPALLLQARAQALVCIARGAGVAAMPAAAPMRHVAFEHAFEWTSEEAIYTSPLVPADGLKMLIEQIEALG
jgi:uncharacterized protein